MAKPLRYRDYTSRWADEFQRIANHLRSFLQPYIIDIYHVGSTSVPSLGAKPIIDIDIVYTDHFDTIVSLLEAHNYRYQGEKGIPERHAFQQLDHSFHEHHLYLCHTDSKPVQDHLMFKRTLLNKPHYRTKYMKLKQQLIADDIHDRERYTNGKTAFIQSILQEAQTMKSIIFAGGCFWGVEAYFKQLDGVTDTEVGYINGPGEVTYKQVCSGSGHAEAVYIEYDEDKLDLQKLLDHLFNIIDPTTINRQGPDRGVQYRSGIYNYTPQELQVIKQYLQDKQPEYKKPLTVELATNLPFYKAEEYHQDYLDKNVNGYCHVDLSTYHNVK